MAEITTTLEPGAYTGGRSVTVHFPAGARKAIITRDDRSPVLTEILAYDTGYILPIPSRSDGTGDGAIVNRPFTAVTQDGRGNVVYDGGFPKFYNVHIKNANGGTYPATLPTTLAGLPPASKYLLNALNFIANPRKVAQGNRKILFLNNSPRQNVYNILGSHYNPDPLQPPGNDGADSGFRDTFQAVAQIGNWIPTFYDCTTGGGGPLSLPLSYFEQFVAVVYLASYGDSKPASSQITEATASNLAQYRAAGNGLAIITDHCNDNFSNLDDAVARGGVFGGDATKVAKYFGAYFSGDVFRQPVSVGEIRRQIGLPGPPEDHPLLAGMSDSELIYAGGSESLIVPELYPSDTVDPSTDWTLNMPTAGTYRVNILVQMETGEIITRPLKYIIINPSDVKITDSINNTIGDTVSTYKAAFDFQLKATGAALGTLRGEIRRNGFLQGYFTSENDVNTYHLFSGDGRGMPVANGDVITMFIKEPYEFQMATTVTLTSGAATFAASGSYPQFLKAVRTLPMYAGKTDAAIVNDIVAFSNVNHAWEDERIINAPTHIWRLMNKCRLPFRGDSILSNCKMWIATNPTEWGTTKPTGPSPGTAAIVATTNDVYYWDDIPMAWVLHPQKANLLFGLHRGVINSRDGFSWAIRNGFTEKFVV
jgi:hypothetical protein